VQEQPPHDGRDWSVWLHETLTAQRVERAHLVGISYGGWVAAQYDLHLPGHAETITLPDPAGFGRVSDASSSGSCWTGSPRSARADPPPRGAGTAQRHPAR